jgi:hypothetical protein
MFAAEAAAALKRPTPSLVGCSSWRTASGDFPVNGPSDAESRRSCVGWAWRAGPTEATSAKGRMLPNGRATTTVAPSSG